MIYIVKDRATYCSIVAIVARRYGVAPNYSGWRSPGKYRLTQSCSGELDLVPVTLPPPGQVYQAEFSFTMRTS